MLSTSTHIGELIARQAREAPTGPAIEAPGMAPLTYAGLESLVTQTQQALARYGLGPGDRVAIMLDNGPLAATAFLGVATGLSCAPLNPAYRASELAFYLDDLRVSALIVERGAGEHARTAAANADVTVLELVPTGDAAGTFELHGGDAHRAARGSNGREGDHEIALLLHTSGTTSTPKLVPLTHANLTASAHNVAHSLELTQIDRCLNVMPLFHIHGLVAGLLAPLATGGTVICTPGFEANRFLDLVERLRPTWYTAVPTIHQAVLGQVASRGGTIDSTLRFVRSSSAALPRTVLEGLEASFGCPVVEAYGMTEASHQMAANPLPPGVRKPGSVGLPSGTSVAILDPEGTLLEPGRTGEVAVRGPGLFGGYEANPEANASSFTDGWFRTGDIGALDDDGYLTLQGRSKEIINRGGEKIAPLEVEEVLLEHPAVAQIAVFARPHPTLGEYVAAAVVVADGAPPPTVRSLREFAAGRLADFKFPSSVVVLDELPKGPTGKVQRVGMAERLELDGRPASSAPSPEPDTALERELVEIWREVFERDDIGVDDDFFELGGESLIAAQLLAWIGERGLGPDDLPLETLLRTPTVSELARWLEGGAIDGDDRVVVAKPGEPGIPALFYIGGHDGEIVRFGPLASRLGTRRPCLALVPPDTLPPNDTLTVELLATDYTAAVRAVQPEGPYAIFGRCMGASVALEVARRLDAAGEEVAFLGLLDPVGDHPGTVVHYWRRFQNFRRQKYLVGAAKIFVRTRLSRSTPSVVETPFARGMLDAGARYVPQPYRGSATLYRTISYITPPSFWRKMVLGDLRTPPPVLTTTPEQFDQLAPQVDEALAEIEPSLDPDAPDLSGRATLGG